MKRDMGQSGSGLSQPLQDVMGRLAAAQQPPPQPHDEMCAASALSGEKTHTMAVRSEEMYPLPGVAWLAELTWGYTFGWN